MDIADSDFNILTHNSLYYVAFNSKFSDFCFTHTITNFFENDSSPVSKQEFVSVGNLDRSYPHVKVRGDTYWVMTDTKGYSELLYEMKLYKD
jgi:hypothetical protein